MKKQPIKYTEVEGGEWLDWPEDHPIDMDNLDSWRLLYCQYPRMQLVFIDGRKVHSLDFENGNVWDSFNGWRINESIPG